MGEKIAAEYLRRRGMVIIDVNVRTSFGELDLVAHSGRCLHLLEVKSLRCREYPKTDALNVYDPGENLHPQKLRKVARMAIWYVAKIGWEGDVQIDGALVWLRERDGMARIRYYPQIL